MSNRDNDQNFETGQPNKGGAKDGEELPLNQKELSPDEKRDQYIDDLVKQIKSKRQGEYQSECCIAFWLFVLTLLLFTVFTGNREDCFFLGGFAGIFGFLSLCFVCCRVVDCCFIVCPLGKRSIHWATSFHEWNNQFQYQCCKWFLILATISWFILEPCEGFRPFMTFFLLVTWILVIIWKCHEEESD